MQSCSSEEADYRTGRSTDRWQGVHIGAAVSRSSAETDPGADRRSSAEAGSEAGHRSSAEAGSGPVHYNSAEAGSGHPC